MANVGEIKVTDNGNEYAFDATMVKLESERLEAIHSLKPEGGEIKPTALFLRDLSESLRQVGYADMTPTLANLAWIEAHKYFNEVQKKTNGLANSATGTTSTSPV